MSRAGIYTALAIAFCIGVAAQTAAKPSVDTQKVYGGKPGPATMRGCLQIYQGIYMLTDSTGTSQRLSGSRNLLKQFVSHEVELTGKPTIRTIDTTQAGAASSAIEQHVFEVSTVKDIAGACQ